jgi:dipeptidase E
MRMKLLLISNSTNPGEDYLGWPRQYISDFMKTTGAKRVLFVPYAGVTISYDDYEQRVAGVYKELGYEIYSTHREKDPVKAVSEAEAIAVGGGNTFYLVYMLHKLGLIEPIREKVLKGLPYMGWSAGANVACPPLRTTNDMPIIEPACFNCFNLVNFQINPHYLDAHPEGHGGETRQQRIEEFLAANQEITVTGLRETSLFRIDGNKIDLLGKKNMRLFRYGQEPQEFEPGQDVNFLLK